MSNTKNKVVTVTVSYDKSDKKNPGYAYWATYADGEPEGSGGLEADTEEGAVAEAQSHYPDAKVVLA